MSNTMRALINYVSFPWAMNQDDGTVRRGCSVEYIDLEEESENPKDLGSTGCRVSVEPKFYTLFQPGQVPGIFDITFTRKSVKRGTSRRSEVKLQAVHYVSPVERSNAN